MLTKAKNIITGLSALDSVTRGGGVGQVLDHFRRRNHHGVMGQRPESSYSQVAAVYNCVCAKSDALGMMPLRVSDQNDQVIESGPLAELAIQPSPAMTGRQFRRATSSHLDLFGRVHWVFTTNAAGQPTEGHVVNPLQMRPEQDKQTGELIGWWFRPAGKLRGAREELIPADEVHTILDPHFEDPDNPFEGLSPRKAVANAIGQQYKADIANEAILHNGVEPSGVLSTDQSLTDPQRDHIRRETEEKNQGPTNRRQFMLLEGGLKWQPTQSNLKDMEFAELKRMTRTDICSAFQVPPSVAGYYEDDNRAHADAAERMFWTNTMLPRAEWIAEEWTLAVVSRFENDRSLSMTEARTASLGEIEQRCQVMQARRKQARRSGRRFFAWFDSSNIPAVQRANLAQVETAKGWNELGVPLSDIIEATGAPFPVRPWQKTWYKPAGKVDVQDESSGLGNEPSGGDDETALVPENNSSGGDHKSRTQANGKSNGASGRAKAIQASEHNVARVLSPQMRGRLWHAWRRSWQGLENSFRSKVRRHFHELRQAQLEQMKRVLGQASFSAEQAKDFTASERRDLVDQLLFDIADADGSLVTKTRSRYRRAVARHRLRFRQGLPRGERASSEPASTVRASRGPSGRVGDVWLSATRHSTGSRAVRLP